MRSDARGRYRILLRQPDSAGMYVVSAWYDSLAYFSLPLNVIDRPAVHVEDIMTFPTSTSGPPLKLARRLATVAAPHDDGTREVLEILEIENPGATTRITKDTLAPTWAGRVPANAVDVVVCRLDPVGARQPTQRSRRGPDAIHSRSSSSRPSSGMAAQSGRLFNS